MATERKIAPPHPNPETRAYWDAATAGKLLIRKCESCGRFHHYPRALCPFCFSDATSWQTASGQGKIYSYSVMRRAEVPYAMAYVTLDEGVTMLTNIVDCNFDALKIGQAVRVVFRSTTEGAPPVPMFTVIE
jgi:uncharacterized OB-fold protein